MIIETPGNYKLRFSVDFGDDTIEKESNEFTINDDEDDEDDEVNGDEDDDDDDDQENGNGGENNG